MLIAAVLKTTPWWQNLSLNGFDVAIVLLLAFGFWRGRKRGMSREALPTAFWLMVVIGAGLGYQPLAELILPTGYVRKIFGTSVSERTMAYVVCYLFIVMVVIFINSLLKKVFKEKVSGSNAFGNGEYYLGMISGMVRYACIAMFFLALINAPYYTAADIQAQKEYNNRWFGGGLKDYSGDFIPSVAETQAAIFQHSFIGPIIKNNLSALLIQSNAPGKRPAKKL